MGDLRVPIDPALSAFGVPVTVTRPAPDNTPVATTGVWVVALEEVRPIGSDFQRREPRRLMALPRHVLSTIPRFTTVVAPEQAGAAAKTWKVDALELVEADCWRVVLVPST